ncbi:MAG: hypothetical protein OXF74_07250 [Rhodobacteraceae bacterium]|nr:hypothetical protein [Paracoccaceae bacterium]
MGDYTEGLTQTREISGQQQCCPTLRNIWRLLETEDNGAHHRLMAALGRRQM